jgi:DNA-binding NarL/FixJ family response regulator
MLADDQPLVRAGFRMLLEVEDDIEVVGEADDGEAALQLISTLAPDVVLMDICMPGVDGLEALRRMSGDDAMSATKVLVLTTFELDEYVFAALRLGASGFLLKHTKPGDLGLIRPPAQREASPRDDHATQAAAATTSKPNTVAQTAGRLPSWSVRQVWGRSCSRTLRQVRRGHPKRGLQIRAEGSRSRRLLRGTLDGPHLLDQIWRHRRAQSLTLVRERSHRLQPRACCEQGHALRADGPKLASRL